MNTVLKFMRDIFQYINVSHAVNLYLSLTEH